jgi:hypothetical protein
VSGCPFCLAIKLLEGGAGLKCRLVNIQAVIADTQRGIAQVQLKIDQLLRQDICGRALVSAPYLL